MKNNIKSHESTKEIQQAIKGVLDERNLIGELQLEECEILCYSDETDYLTDQTITETYKRKLETHTEYLHKTNENRCFISKPSTEPFALFVIEESRMINSLKRHILKNFYIYKWNRSFYIAH